ncbi:3-dehydroquinate synthase [Blattabacterium cuenoti]|nr:3-dehydroquinate synthase [Blattabacterium cuenoti]
MILFDEIAYKELQKYLLYEVFSVKEIFILVDDLTKKYCLPILIDKINFLKKSNIIQISHGEKEKNIYTCIKIFKEIEKYNSTRNSIIINLGGGVITDIGGFVASIFKRGIRFINIPTTLLGMVDAAIGYKTGVNLDNIKNELGLFSYPKILIIDSNYIQTLNKKEILSGIAEMFKHGIIANKHFWNEMKKNYSNIISKNITKKKLIQLISKSIEIKQKIVDKDPKEKGLRKILNFGHTIGHALESLFLNKKNIINHGIAVANGIIRESWISCKDYGLSYDNYKEIKQILYSIYPIIKNDFSNYEIKKLFNIMQHDKKNEKEKIQFSLINHIGNCSYNCVINNEIIKKSFTEII